MEGDNTLDIPVTSGEDKGESRFIKYKHIWDKAASTILCRAGKSNAKCKSQIESSVLEKIDLSIL